MVGGGRWVGGPDSSVDHGGPPGWTVEVTDAPWTAVPCGARPDSTRPAAGDDARQLDEREIKSQGGMDRSISFFQ